MHVLSFVIRINLLIRNYVVIIKRLTSPASIILVSFFYSDKPDSDKGDDFIAVLLKMTLGFSLEN